jgi:hypothetical protein
MVVLRRTQRLAAALPASIEAGEAAESETALGDWYVNRLVVDRRPLLLLVSARGLLPMVVPARNVSSLPGRLPELVGARLRRLGVPPPLIAAEVAAMAPVGVGRTADRSVVGVMVDFAKHVPFYLDVGGWDDSTLPFVEAKLAQTPLFVTGRDEDVVFPDQTVPELLRSRWT